MDIITWVTTVVGRIENLLPIIAILMVGIAVLRVYHRSQGSLVPTLTTLLIGGAIVWGIMNVTWFQNSVGGVFTTPSGSASHSRTVVPAEHADGPIRFQDLL